MSYAYDKIGYTHSKCMSNDVSTCDSDWRVLSRYGKLICTHVWYLREVGEGVLLPGQSPAPSWSVMREQIITSSVVTCSAIAEQKVVNELCIHHYSKYLLNPWPGPIGARGVSIFERCGSFIVKPRGCLSEVNSQPTIPQDSLPQVVP